MKSSRLFTRVVMGVAAALALLSQSAVTASAAPARPASSVACSSGPLQVRFNDFGGGTQPSVFWSAGVFCGAPAFISLSSRITLGFGTIAFGTSPSAFTQLLFTTSPNNNAVNVPRGFNVEVLATATIRNTTGGVVTVANTGGGNCVGNNTPTVTCNYSSGFFRP